MNKIAKIKLHLHNNKKVYIACSVTAVVTGVTVLFLGRNDQSAEMIQKVTQFGFRNESNPIVINLIERSTASKPVHLVGTNLYFNSLSEAARETGHSLTRLSKHVNGHLPDLSGDIFELLEPAV